MEPLRPLWQGRKLARRIVDNPKASIINQMLKLPDPKIVPAPVSLNIAFPNNLPQDDAMICAGLGRVLVIDDSLMTLKVMVRRLGNAGFVVESAPNGYFGLQMMQNKLYDCVYLDLEMPVMDGFDCARNIRNWEASVGRSKLQTICALTSSTGEAVEKKTQGSGFDNFVSKPADIKTVLALCSSSSPGDVELENQFEDEDGVGKTQIFLAPKFVRGVEVQCRDASSAIYYNGSVMKHNGNLTYTILYEDGQVEECVRELRMRYPNQVQKASLEVGEVVDCLSKAMHSVVAAGKIKTINSGGVADAYLVEFESIIGVDGAHRETINRKNIFSSHVFPKDTNKLNFHKRSPDGKNLSFQEQLALQLNQVNDKLDSVKLADQKIEKKS